MNNKSLFSFARGVCAAVMLAGAATTSHATTVFWAFQGNEIDSGSPGLSGNVIITLNDDDVSGSVKLTIDGRGLAAGEFIRDVFFTTDFNVNASPFLFFSPPAGFSSYATYAANENAFTPIAGIMADAVVRFNGTPDPVFDNAAGIFQATFTRPGLQVSDFLTNDAGAPYEIALHAQGLGPDGTQGAYYSGERITSVPVPASLPLLAGGLGLASLIVHMRKRKRG